MFQHSDHWEASPGDDHDHLWLLNRRSGERLHLEGQFLEAELSHHDDTLVFLWNDDPAYAALRIYLIAPKARVLDALEIGANMCPGSFRDLHLEQEWLQFSYFEGSPYRVQILPRPRRANPLLRMKMPECKYIGSTLFKPHYLHIEKTKGA